MTTNQLPELTGAPVFIVLMEDELIHTDEHLFCGSPDCPCHDDSDLVREHLIDPLNEGLLTDRESIALYWNRQV